MGEIGVAEKEGAIRIATAEIERNAMVKENERNAEIAASNAELAKAEAEAKQVSEVARIEAENNAKKREAELEREVYELKKQMEMEEKRSRLLTSSKVSAEAAVAEAEGKAEAMKLLADAKFYQQSKEAEGILVTYDARAEGLSRLYSAAGSDSDLVKYELGLDKELFKKLAEENAKAVQGLNPKINVWNTGSSTADPMNPILNVVQSMAPMLDGLQGKLDFSKLSESTEAFDKE
jgi:flotillin